MGNDIFLQPGPLRVIYPRLKSGSGSPCELPVQSHQENPPKGILSIRASHTKRSIGESNAGALNKHIPFLA